MLMAGFAASLLLLASTSSTPATPETTAACAIEEKDLLQLAPDKFDQDFSGGWRPLGQKAGCEGEAAKLIKTYINARWRDLKPGQLHTLYWHAGQMEAMAGHYDLAVPYFMAGVYPTTPNDYDFEDYSLGTIAFLRHDLPGLKAARERLAKAPEPVWYKEAVAKSRAEHPGYTIKAEWPANLNVLDALIRCFDRPYREAYGDKACQNP